MAQYPGTREVIPRKKPPADPNHRQLITPQLLKKHFNIIWQRRDFRRQNKIKLKHLVDTIDEVLFRLRYRYEITLTQALLLATTDPVIKAQDGADFISSQGVYDILEHILRMNDGKQRGKIKRKKKKVYSEPFKVFQFKLNPRFHVNTYRKWDLLNECPRQRSPLNLKQLKHAKYPEYLPLKKEYMEKFEFGLQRLAERMGVTQLTGDHQVLNVNPVKKDIALPPRPSERWILREERLQNGFDMKDGIGQRFYRGRQPFFFALDGHAERPKVFGYMSQRGFGLKKDSKNNVVLVDLWQLDAIKWKDRLGTENWGGQNQRDIFGVGWRTPGMSDGMALLDHPFSEAQW